MKLSDRIKPISYLKAHAPEVIQGLRERQEPFIITVNGEAKAVLQDIDSYEETQETLALLKILALGEAEYEAGQFRPAEDVFADLKARLEARLKD